MEEAIQVLTIKELVLRGRSLTATSSLISEPKSNRRRQFSLPHSTSTNPNSSSKILTPLSHPAILIGTLVLPTETLKCSKKNCFQFSDGSSTVCCDILDFRVNIIGKRIRVLSWNFIPFKHSGISSGFLEIIGWSFVDSSSGVLSRCSSSVDSFHLVSGTSNEDQPKARYRVHGPIESISPVSIVPCSIGDSKSQNLRGFVARIMVCECKLCNSKEPVTVLHNLGLGNDSHSYTKSSFVYFCGSSWCWHPVIAKIVGSVISLSGLKKKLVFIGKDESQLMFVTTENSVLHLPGLLRKWSQFSSIKGKGECGGYTGVIKGVHMQGMVVELDKEVWLLLTDRLVTAPHSLREGAIISVRNVHFVNPKFSWSRMLILGACFKTSITVESFSPSETGCHVVSQSQSQLEKFIGSLTFSARLWMLLVISGFCKKFTRILSEEEILGSKHEYQKQGLAQMFTSSHLPASSFRAQHGVLREFCKHESNGCGSKPYYGNLKLVAPLCTFFSHCENMWMRTIFNDCHILHDNSQFNFLSNEGRSYTEPLRKIFPSEEIGILLLGNLKISPSSGRLQLVDATGSIDVLIPDLPYNWKTNSIYEVVKYSIIMEGIPEVVRHLGLLDNESLSCRHIFHYIPCARELNLTIYLYFNLSHTVSKNLCLYPPVSWNDNLQELQNGTFHVIWILHKYPVLQQAQGDQVISDRSTVFVEAIVLPWDLTLDGIDATTHPGKISRIWLNEALERYAGENHQDHLPNKRCKTDCTSSQASVSGSVYDHSCAGNELSNFSNSLSESTGFDFREPNSSSEILCLAIVRNANGHNFVSLGKLCCTKFMLKTGMICRPNGRKVLLEFSSESFFKYQRLQIGGYYMIKHHTEESFCSMKDFDNISGGKIHLSSGIHLWSLSFSSEGVLINDPSSDDASKDDSSFSSEEILIRLRSGRNSPEYCSDVHLHLSSNIIPLLKLKLNKMKESLLPIVTTESAFNESPHILTRMSASGVSFASSDSSCLFPEGNLISVLGNVVAIHGFNSDSSNGHSTCETMSHIICLGFFRGSSNGSCIHVLVDNQMVSIFGSLSKHAYAVGFGAGVNATFHRILKLRGTNILMLTPVSFIVVNSIRVTNEPHNNESADLGFNLYISSDASLDKVSCVMISQLIQCKECSPVKLNCRVVAVHMLVLENRKCSLLSKVHSRQHFVDVPLAVFVLDDGSSSYCCWANADRAATLLRLHEELPMTAFESTGCTLKWLGMDKTSWKTAIYHLERILKKHDRIIVKNHGSITDSLYQELTVSVGSDDGLPNLDEHLLKFIITNACFGTVWTVIASVMDSNIVNQLEKEHLMQMEMTMHPMQNVWAMEVGHTNTLYEARYIVEELLRR